MSSDSNTSGGIHWLWYVLIFVTLLFGCWISLFELIPSGKVGVMTSFGVVDQEKVYKPGGPYLVLPLHRLTIVDTNQHILEITSGKIGTVSDANGVPIDFDVTIPVMINPACAGIVVAKGGVERLVHLGERIAPTAMRDAASSMSWDAMQVSKRTQLSELVKTNFEHYIQRDLVAQGYPRILAGECLRISDVQLQTIEPPQSVQNVLAEKASADIRNQTQDTINAIAEKEAERRTTEGQGIANVMNNLPKGYSSDDVYKVMSAISLKETADAIERGVREGRITMMVVPANSPLSLSHP